MHYSKVQLTTGLIMATILLLITGLMASAQAASGLPDRNPPEADKGKGGDNSGPIGTYIELVAPGQAGAWSVVQWQDSVGNWHDVEGWRGTLDSQGVIRWWVDAKDFGTGPFRWVIEGASSAAPAGLWAADDDPESAASEWAVGDTPLQSEAGSQQFNLPSGATDLLMVMLP
jgi:hypothetical protein